MVPQCKTFNSNNKMNNPKKNQQHKNAKCKKNTPKYHFKNHPTCQRITQNDK